MLLKQFIDKQIGFGKYQIQSFVILSCVGINDGVEVILSSFLNPILKKIDSRFTSSAISLITSLFFIGTVLGSVCSGQLSDKHGRRSIIIFGALLQIISGVIYYLTNEFLLLFFIRFVFGFAFGFSVSICPTKFRGKFIVFLNFSISIGKMYGILLGYLFIKDDLSQTNWKAMMFCGCFPSLVVLFGAVFILFQSPRYLLAQNRFQQAFVVLDKISLQNNPEQYNLLTEEDRKQISAQFSQSLETQAEASYFSLFKPQYCSKTITLLFVWFGNNFCYYAQLSVEAMHISTSSSHINLHNYLITVVGEIPCIFVSLFLVDNIIFGRKRSLVIFNLFGSISHLLFSFTHSVIIGSISNFFMKNVFLIVDPLTTETYSTRIRMKGYNFCAGLGKLGSVVMPYIVFPLDEWNRSSVYILLSLLMLLEGLTVQCTLQQTMNKNID